MNRTFIVCDESERANGYYIRLSGIDFSRFKLNPVMLYMHERASGVIGRWENLRTNGKKLLADAVFDASTILGHEVEYRVLNGFLRAASVGLSDCEIKDDVVERCVLEEISIVDIPAISTTVAMAKKSCENGKIKVLFKLEDNTGANTEDLRESILQLLDLPTNTEDDEILQTIRELVKGAADERDPEYKRINEMRERGTISETMFTALRASLKAARSECKMAIDQMEEENTKKITSMIQQAIRDRKVLPIESDVYKNIGKRIGAEKLSELFRVINPAARVSEFINNQFMQQEKNLEWYRKFNPEELVRNPELYHRLVAASYGESAVKDLEYYRRNNPDYLKEHPEAYSKMVNEL